MTEVLRAGKDLEWTQEIDCESCKSLLKINAMDIILDPQCHGHTNHMCYYAICPKCKSWQLLSDDIPQHVRNGAKNRYNKSVRQKDAERDAKLHKENLVENVRLIVIVGVIFSIGIYLLFK